MNRRGLQRWEASRNHHIANTTECDLVQCRSRDSPCRRTAFARGGLLDGRARSVTGLCNDEHVSDGAEERAVPNDELTADDIGALTWAVSTKHPRMAGILERNRSGGTGVTAGELAAITSDWDA